MSRKLISLVTMQGKTKEQVVKEVWDAFVHYRATELGLTKCAECIEYRGVAVEDGEEINVSCACSWIDCTVCKKVRIRRPISNNFSKEDCKIWHTPYFHHICSNCMK